ncbi:sigma-54-dependent transcriptional regulator [Photobacterium aphoticum]|uniref:Fis family transcriptional regulator n=1 Tax=Photobacterium aphoticum TaxID=754436 RepID=A0A0J1JFK8_9GAMM|nr:sigma-54 dependent transcriptional regulator [Photobacterium aphoticum]KLV00542.1 Fis family transcriptional regulator [Photobacterium aphoticum]PSU59900.1 sigma-54-dependent Fis family transcriptional regulator [Photobacterium aphoticum]GHA41449.1 sigma-54-dependent Fis family transcriptional regulator [Photobacterium aphoticum]
MSDNAAMTWSAVSVLVVDDEPGMRAILKKALSKQFAQVDVAGSIEEAEELRKRCHFDLLIVDINLPGRSGIEWHEAFDPSTRRSDVIFMTGYADLDTAIRALRAGASDFILKPFNLEQMMQSVQRCIERRMVERQNFALQRDVERTYPVDIIGDAQSTLAMKKLITQIAPSMAAVLVEGESGTGKELVARALHQLSKRSGPFVPLNCGAIAPDLLESELFGHVSGAFTGAKKGREGLFRVANNGTLFLDEIGEMPLAMQSSLLRALEQKAIRPVGAEREVQVDVRIVAATNRNLKQEVEEGRFRRDLYYRLNVLTIELPSLRDRLEDIPALAHHFTQQLAKDLGAKPVSWTHEDIQAMQAYDWPGNIRELRNMMERCLLLGKPPADYWHELAGDAAPLRPVAPVSVEQEQTENVDVVREPGDDGKRPCKCHDNDNEAETYCYPSDWTLKDVEKAHIMQVVDTHEGNKSAAARQLGVARKTLERKYKEWADEAVSTVEQD